MRIFEIIKENVNLREAAELYGIDVNRYGKALCPFHNDRHPSLYVADDHYYCFACGEHGDVIDFVGRLFQLSPYNAARKLMADFHLSPDKPPSAAALHAKRIRTEAQQLMENERLCFSVLSDYLRKGKERLNTSLNTLRPALAQYNQVAKDIRDKTKERRSVLSEKKALSAVHVFRHRELAAKIAALTEDLEELRSEKNLLLASLAYTEEDAAEQFPKDIAAMEQSLKRLEEREQKYSAELDAALNEYAGLREQAQGFDPVQLYEARQAIRPGKEQEAESRAQQVYGEKYSPLLMFDSKKAVSRMLHEDMERQAVRRMMRRAQEGQQIPQKKKDKGQER